MSRSNTLGLEEFEHLLDVHGAKLERWPGELSARARELLEASEEARARWSEALALAALLDAAPRVEPSSELMARIATLPARHPRSSRTGWWPFGKPFAPLLAWGAAAALGLVVGTLAPELDGVEGSTELSADGAVTDDWSELSDLALGADLTLEDE